MIRLGVLVTLLVALVAGCGTGAQREPEPVQLTTPTSQPRPAPDGTAAVRIYLVKDGRLFPVIRRSRPSSQDVLALLAAGPTAQEAATGLRSAVPAQPLAARFDPADSGTVLVSATVGFTTLPAHDQLLATAQLVWTLTEVRAVPRVRVVLDGRPVAVPTDGGPSTLPVRRTDFRSVAPP